MQLLLLACAAEPAPAAGVDAEVALVAADAGALRVRRALVADVGAIEDGAWAPREAAGIALPAEAELPWGAATLTVARPCGPATVPVRVGAGAQVVVPVPACAEGDAPPLPDGPRLDRHERTWAELTVLAELGVLSGVARPEPGEEATPARFVDHAQAATACAFFGGRLPTAAEWAAGGGLGADRRGEGPAAVGDPGFVPAVGPAGHEALDGNVAEWLAAPEGAVRAQAAGGSWLRAERTRSLPVQAREEDVGFRCVFSVGAAP